MDLNSIFRNTFDRDLINRLQEKASIIEVPAGTTILKVGDVIRVVPIVLSGLIKVVRQDDDGHELLLYYVNAAESCAMTVTSYMQRSHSEIMAIAEDTVQLMVVPVDVADDLYAQYAGWKSFVMKTIRDRFRELLVTIDQIAFQKLDERLVNYLRDRSRATGSPLLNVSHEQIAIDLATSRVVISRLLKKLEQEKKVNLYRNQIRLMAEM
ncbi:MAG: Crp/Fnr family transcriptional regulator [Chitinophagaceae bacterium]|nr:Crp/Fnr family transcriptional regulator [Chitinophagaceae bacterium]